MCPCILSCFSCVQLFATLWNLKKNYLWRFIPAMSHYTDKRKKLHINLAWKMSFIWILVTCWAFSIDLIPSHFSHPLLLTFIHHVWTSVSTETKKETDTRMKSQWTDSQCAEWKYHPNLKAVPTLELSNKVQNTNGT